MKNIYLTGLVCLFSSLSISAQEPALLPKRLSPVNFTQVHFQDSFWLPKINVNRKVSIPSAFNECEKNGRFDNFALAAGLIKGEHKGDFSFDDTDPYKVIEGASYALATCYDSKLDAYIDSVIHIIAAAQEPDGYLCTCVTNKCTRLSGWWGKSRWEKINSHELYNCGHLYEAAVAHYLATGKRTLLDVAVKNADLVCRVFGPSEGQIHRPSGHPIIEMALCKLYQVTGKQDYLDMARYFVEETGRGTDGHQLSAYSQDHMPILQQEEIVGHAVRAGYLYSGVADVAALTGDTAYFHALLRLWDNMANKKLYVTGGIGSRAQGEGFGPEYELNNHTAYCETCASIANVYWNHRMFLSTGDSRFIDVLERALYNGVISGVSLSGDRFFYDNPLESMGQHDRQCWFGCACCPGNITRFMASVPGYVYAMQGNHVYVNLWISNTASLKNDDMDITISQQSGLPWHAGLSLTVNCRKKQNVALHLRIPAWLTDRFLSGSDLYEYATPAGRYVVTVNGKAVKGVMDKGYLVIDRRWKDGDKVHVDFDMPVRRIHANNKVEDDRQKTALQRGPLVYCFEGIDQPDGEVFNKYLTAQSRFYPADSAQMLGGITVLQGNVMRVPDEGDSQGREQQSKATAVPYYSWDNRGPGQMAVWLPETAEVTRPVLKPSLASRARSVMIKAPIQKDAPVSASTEEWAFGVNDGWEPKSSHDTSKPYFYWWLKRGSRETLAYTFEQPETLHSVSVYWLEMDHYDGNYRVPTWWKLYYKDNDTWKEVKALSPYGVKIDQYNKVEFEPVTTTTLKMEVQLQPGQSGGVLEWKLNQ